MREICPKNKCTGCAACFNICGKSAIKMTEDDCGFIHPLIESNLCIDCGLCAKVCPVNTKVALRYPLNCYAATVKNDKELRSVASGGMATELSRYVIDRGGVVYGCSGKNIRYVHHIRVDKIEDIEFLKGSKYVQSFIGGIYKDVKKDLQEGRLVLFVGTPCQVAGLLGFLQHKDYSNLITADLVCHGVPSQKMLNDNISLYCDKKEKISICFRHKEQISSKYDVLYKIIYGWFYKTCSMNVLRKVEFYKDPYMFGFLAPLTLRSSCYICRYANISRCGDFTFGDFWGLGKDAGFVNGKGVSLVLINTIKAITLWSEVSKRSIYVQRDIVEAQKGNGQLQVPSRMHKNYEIFVSLYPKLGFRSAVYSSLRKDLYKIRYNIFKSFIKQLIKR